MATRKFDPHLQVRRRPVRLESDRLSKEDVEVMHSRLQAAEPLALDDNDLGGDPYNSTGRFSTLKPAKTRRSE